MKETADIMAMLQKMDIHKIVDGLGGGYGNYGGYTMPDETIADLISRVVEAHENAEVKTAGVLAIQNYEKLVGHLGFYGGLNWDVYSVTEKVGHYDIRITTPNGMKCFVYDLARTPAEHGGYELRKGYETLTIFRLHELQSPLKLYNALRRILDNETIN